MKRFAANLFLLALISFSFQCARTTSADADVKSKTLLAIFAHPDDETTVSALLAKYAAEGATVYIAVATDGRLGVTEHARIPAGDSLASVRAGEMRCAAEKLGVQPPIMFGLEDQLKMGEGFGNLLRQVGTMHEKVNELFNTLQPDVVITWGASGWTGHPDHRLVHSVVTEVFESRNWGKPAQLLYPAIPAGNTPNVSEIQRATVDPSLLTVRVPIEQEYYDKALASWHCHASQYKPEEIETMNAMVNAYLKGVIYLQPYRNPGTIRTSIF